MNKLTKILILVASSGLVHAQNNEDKSKNEISYENIFSVMEASKKDIFEHYLELLKTDPKAEGDVVLEISVEGTGSVSDVEIIESDFIDDEFNKTILKIVKSLKFDQTKNKNLFEYAFKFRLE